MKTDVTAPRQQQRWLGRAIPRLEDRRLVTGRGRYLADVQPVPNIHHAAILRSPCAHARISAISAAEARKLPGVRAVLTGADFAALMGPLPVVGDHPGRYYPCAVDKVRYVGEPVAVVVAKDRYVAEDALALIDVDYEPLPAVVDVEAAMADESPLLHEEEGTNVALHRAFRFGDVDAAFDEAEVVVRERVEFNRFTCLPLETYGVVADWDTPDGGATIWANFQGPFSMHAVMAAALRLPPNKLRIVVPADVGGGFGIKISIYPYMCLLAVASRLSGVPVKWVEDRLEHLPASSSGTDRVSYVELAARRDGVITGFRLKAIDNVGAYLRAPEPGTSMRPFGNYTGGYDIRNVELDLWAVMSNKVPTGPNRGYSCGHLYHALERAVDKLANELAMDPAALRLTNLVPSAKMPYRTATGGYYDAGDFPAVFRRLLDVAGYDELRRQQELMRREGRLVGIGLCAAVDPSASNIGYVAAASSPERRKKEAPKSGTAEAATIVMDWGGRLTVTLNTCPTGQGHETTAAQIVADEFGCSPYDIVVTTGSDTATRAWTIASGTYSSRFAGTGASAVLTACRGLKVKLCRLASYLLGCPVEQLEIVGEQVVDRSNPGRAVSLKRVAGAIYWNPSVLPEDLDRGLSYTAYFNIDEARPLDELDRIDSSGLYSFAADLVMVEIDRRTYRVEIVKYVSAHDIGRILNPQIVEGQIYGGTLHGLAGALFEELVYDANGQLLTGTLMDYACPTFCEAPKLEVVHLETPSSLTPLGARGVGEAASMTAPAAVVNAVCDALRPLGIAVVDLPITPSRLFAAIRGEHDETR